MTDHDQSTQREHDPAAGHAPAAGPDPVATADDVAGPHGDPLTGEALPADDARPADDSRSTGPGEPAQAAAEPGAPGEAEQAGDEASVDADLEALRARAGERDEYLALAQRAQADFDNYRKRMAREAAQAQERGMGRLAKELLPALDHLELALKAAEADGGELFKGVRMVQEEMIGALGRVGIEAFSPAGEPFDPNEHEAMVQRPVDGAEPGTVVEVYQQGYRINGAVLRPARVVVAA